MILIDTNVVSELMRPTPAQAVLDWFGAQDPSTLHLSAVSEAELRRGVAVLPEGRRRDALRAAVDAMVAEDFSIAPGFAGTPLTAYRKPMEVLRWMTVSAEEPRPRLRAGSGG